MAGDFPPIAVPGTPTASITSTPCTASPSAVSDGDVAGDTARDAITGQHRHEADNNAHQSAGHDRMEWLIQCRDALQRDRSVTVRATDGDVLIVGPPGEAAVLDAGQLKQFRTALEQAARLVEGRR